jgi:DNA-binding LacI/PurR family transcriptional regulator
MRNSHRVTIKDVARIAGVSAQTISRVVNHHPDVASETRARVQQIIAEMGYQPSALARSLIQQRSYTLGVVTAGLRFIGPSRTLNGITQQAEARGYSLLLIELPDFTTGDIQALLQSLLSRHVDGILWAAPEIGDNRAWLSNSLPDLGVPILFLTMEPRQGISTVTIDNYQGGCMATQHLLDQGYRHIGHITGPLEWWEARQRKAGWVDTLSRSGISVLERQWAEGNWSSSSGDRAFRQLVDQYPELDAVFVANDQMALSVLQLAHKAGKEVPTELGVVGFDGLAEAAYYYPSLTTVNQDQHQLGCLAVNELVEAIETMRSDEVFRESETLLIQPDLIVRESTRNAVPATNEGELTR